MTENRKYYSNLIFCNSPVKQKYKFGDLFQIYPLPEEYQIKYDRQTHFPFIIEYYINLNEVKPTNNKLFEGIEKLMAETTVQNNWLNLLIKLLSVFTNHHFFTYDIEQGWFFPMNTDLPKEEVDKLTSSWGFRYYHIDGIKKILQIDRFSEINCDEIKVVEHIEYFQRPELDDTKLEVKISKFTNAIFQSFTMLNQEERKYFDASVTLIYNGQQIRHKMRSLAYLSFISSIETMTSYEFKDKQESIEFKCHSCKLISKSPFECKECGNPIWGISQQFKAYLMKYLTSDPKANSIINKIYGIRSKIAHSGQLLLGDSFIEWDKDEQHNKELEALISVMQYSKMSLVNWLITNGKTKAAANIGFAKVGHKY
jgi:hypothetical protein